MDEKIETYDVEPGEITFRSVGRFIKRCWLRTVIYIAAAVLLATLVLVPLKFILRSAPTVSTRLEFVYEGVNSGLDPAGGTFEKDAIRSASVVSSAITQAGLTSKLTDVDAVRNAIVIGDVYTAEYLSLKELADKGDADAIKQLAGYTYHPTKYDVSLGNLKALGLDKQEAILLVEKVVKAYKEWFASRYTQKNIYSTSIFAPPVSETNMDYLSYYDLYTGQLTSMSTYLQQMTEKDASFRSSVTNKTFSDLIQMYQAVDSSYETFKSYIVSNKVSKNLTVTRNNIETTVKKYENSKTSLEQTRKALQDQISAYSPNTSTSTSNGTTTVVQTYPPEYHKLQTQLTSCILELATVTNALAEYEMRATAFRADDVVDRPDDDPLITSADNMLAKLRADSSALVVAINDTIKDFFDSKLLSNAVRVVQPAVYVRVSASIPTLYIYIAAIAVGLIAALIVTQVQYKRGAKTVEETESQPQETKEEQA